MNDNEQKVNPTEEMTEAEYGEQVKVRRDKLKNLCAEG